MSKNTRLLLIGIAIVSTGSFCSMSTETPAPTEGPRITIVQGASITPPPTPSPTPGPIPSAIVSTPTPTGIPTAAGVCEGQEWGLVPIDVTERLAGDGWKQVIISLALYNGSPYLGTFAAYLDGVFLQTEGGFTYPPENHYSHFDDQSQAYIDYSSQLPNGPLLAPGFAVRCRFDQLGMSVYGSTSTNYSLVFKVGENLQHHSVYIPRVTVTCFPDPSKNF